ncbi:Heat shock transcription factor, X-linked member 3 [Takifugu flavidus]|uniref:Heat shock transcription factor, X-linked member 3 n=1 Tax=Takifugu flavidus TaxID=433684 RepID=A0A5C6MIC3_9TELE|nr:Heat shock transcription factor, X-linked member 3 [Takifugu flavidus]
MSLLVDVQNLSDSKGCSAVDHTGERRGAGRQNEDGDIDTIVWNQQGDGIIINKDLMEKEFLSLNYFEASSSSSFGRQLNLYGFKKSRPFIRDKPNIHHYFHPNFNLNFFPF